MSAYRWVIPVLVASLASLCGCQRAEIAMKRTADGTGYDFHVESLGEYPTSFERIKVTLADSSAPVWEIAADGSAQLWRFTLKPGLNKAEPQLANGRVRILVPSDRGDFPMIAGETYLLSFWARSGKRNDLTFTL